MNMPEIARFSVETAFGSYQLDTLLGEGGAGRVYGGVGPDGPVAVKVLTSDKATKDRRQRFKNEIAFLLRNKHPNIVSVIDHGVVQKGKITGPFYVMRRYDKNLRQLIRGKISPQRTLPLYGQILDGIEAAHLQRVVHRDLKPENILYDEGKAILSIADFGVASFTDELLATLVETAPTQRLANFQYAAPEQRTPGTGVSIAADIYALGLILNEMFTGAVPHGTDYKSIGSVSKEHEFLDPIVSHMLKQTPADRPTSVEAVKVMIRKYQADAVALQRISQIDSTVIKASEIDDPLAYEPPRVIDVGWHNDTLTLTLDRNVSQGWINALRSLRSYRSTMHAPPHAFRFNGNQAAAPATAQDAQNAINYFKEWLRPATEMLKATLQEAARAKEVKEREELRRQRQAEERQRQVNQSLKF